MCEGITTRKARDVRAGGTSDTPGRTAGMRNAKLANEKKGLLSQGSGQDQLSHNKRREEI